MIINIKQYILTITMLFLATRVPRVVSSRGGPIPSPSLPLRYSVSITTSVGGPAPATSPSPAPAPAPATSPSRSPTPASSSSPSPPNMKKPSPATPSPPRPSPATPSPPPPSLATPSTPPPSNPSPSTSAPPPPKQQKIPKVSPVNPSLKYLCKSTDYPALCVSSLSPFIIVGRTNPIGILEAGIKAASRHAELTVSALGRLTGNASYSDEMSSAAVANCKDNYIDALENLKSAASAVSGPTHDVWTANSMLSAVISDSENCEDGFQGVGESPVTESNSKLRMMASNCLAIASLVK